MDKLMEIVVISKEIIKPSKPTPAHLRHYRLSFIDQLSGQIFVPFIYFYQIPPAAGGAASVDNVIAAAAAANLERSKKLKKSLSETLTKYYPLAGRIRNNVYVDCNDEGVEFLEANANCQLSQLLEQSNLAELNKLLPYADPEDTNNLPMAIQVNFFDCGGMAICLTFNHNISDACSILALANYWAAVAREDGAIGNAVDPCFNLHRLFPPKDIPYKYHPPMLHVLAKRFVFSSLALSALVKEYTSGSKSMRLTRVQALSAFIFSRLVAATINRENDTDSEKKQFLFLLTMNLRARMNPPLNGSHFGNVYGHAVLEQVIDRNTTLEGCDLVTKLGDAIRKVDSDFIRQQFTEGLHLSDDGDQCAGKGEVVCFTISSLTGFPMYEADFGWGRPIWVSNGKDPLDNTVSFFPARFGNAIEAVIKLKEEEMVKLESDTLFLAFASPATSGAKVPLPSSL